MMNVLACFKRNSKSQFWVSGKDSFISSNVDELLERIVETLERDFGLSRGCVISGTGVFKIILCVCYLLGLLLSSHYLCKSLDKRIKSSTVTTGDSCMRHSMFPATSTTAQAK